MRSFNPEEKESIFNAQDIMRQLLLVENQLNTMKNEMEKVPKSKNWYFTKDELKRLFHVIKKEVKDTFIEMEAEKEGGNGKGSIAVYKSAVQDEAFFKLLYISSFSIRELIMLPADAYNPVKNEFYWQKDRNGISTTMIIKNRKILYSLKRHSQVNQPKIFLFEQAEGKAQTNKNIQGMFECFCELAQIEDEEKWECQTLRNTGVKNKILFIKPPKIMDCRANL